MAETIAFYTLSILILGLAILVVTARNTVHSVLFLVMNFLCVAVIYVVLEAEFLAVIQILVYAGGIVVLYLFVVMLVNLNREPEVHQDPRRLSLPIALALAGAVLLELAGSRRHRRPSRRCRRSRFKAMSSRLAGCSIPTISFRSRWHPFCCWSLWSVPSCWPNVSCRTLDDRET